MKKVLRYLLYSLLFFLPASLMAQTANHVVISEIYGAGGNTGAIYNSDFVELYNPTGADVDMSGWSVQYNSATGVAAFSGITVFPSGSIIKSHGYFLIQEQSGGSVGIALPTPDIATSGTVNNFNASGTAGKIALVNNSTIIAAPPALPVASIIDFVGFGTTAVNYEGTGPTPAPSSTTSIERKASSTSTALTMQAAGTEDGKGNGYDSDNNANDFIVPTLINPQNSASALETPGGGATATPTIAVTPTSLSFGTTQAVNTTTTTPLTFSITGTNIPATGATVTVAAPFSISATAGGTYGTALVLTQASFAAAQTIYVKFTPTNTTAQTGSAAVAVVGATTQNVALTGTGATATPTLTASTTTLTFASQAAGTTSAAQTFSLSGSGLTANTSLSVASPFAVSKDGITYSTVITYTPTELATAQTVSVVFAPTAAGSPTGTIAIASAGATSLSVALSGTATAASGGSSSAANHVVISEIYGAGGNTGAIYNSDFVELYNPTGADVDMSGWSVQYNSATGVAAFSGITVFPSGSIIKSHGYFLIQEQSGGSVGIALPTPDIATSGTVNNFNASGTAGKIALVNNSTIIAAPPALPVASIIDFVGFGTTAVNYEGTGPTPAPSSTTSIERKASSTSTALTMQAAGTEDGKGNGYDSDNNANDFIVPTLINPQNSASALETPPGTAATPLPTLSVTPTSLSFGTTQAVNTTTTTPLTFSVTGTNIPATGATVTVAAPFSISATAGGTYGTALVLTQASFAAAQTIYVKFSPTTTNAETGSAAVAAVGAIGQGVLLTGTATNAAPVASITVNPTSLAYGTVNTNTPSVKTFTISGANLGTTNAVLTAPATVTLSKLAAGPFTNTLTFTVAELTAATAPTVYAQYAPTTAATLSGNITIADADVATPPSVAVSGTGVVPTLTATTTPATSPTSIAFGNVTVLTNSGGQPFNLAGANLTANVVLTTTAPFSLSTDGGTTYGLTATITAATLAAPQTILVRYSPVAVPASATGSVSITSTGAVTQTVALSGNGVLAPVPTLTVAPTSLTFSGLVGSTSAAQTYTITGANLTGTSTVTVAAPYSVSKTATGTYGLTLSYTLAELATPQTVYVKFSPTVVATNGVNDGAAINGTAGGTNQSVTLSGTGIGVPALTVAPTALTFSQIINTTSAAQSYTLSGVYLTANTTVTVAAPYSISKTSGGSYGTTLTYTTTELATPQLVYVQFKPTVVGTTGNSGSAINASTGATSQSVTLTGTGLAVPTVTANPTSIAFGNQSITATSAGSPFTLTGANITVPGTTVSVGTPFLVSKTSTGGYAASITYTAAEMATPQTVYVNFAPSTKTLFNGTVTIASPGATSATVTLSGTGIDPPNVAPTLNALSDVTLCYTPTAQNVALSGISAVEAAQITAVSVSSSNPALFASMGILPLTASTATLTYTLAPGVSGTAVVSVTVKDNGGTLNGGVDTFTQTFNVTVNALAVVDVSSSANGAPIELGQNVTLTATGGTSYLWSSTTGSSDFINGNTGSSVVVKPGKTLFNPQGAGGTYTGNTVYTVTATNASGCTTTKTITVTTYSARKLVTNNVITPNGDGINDTWNIVNIEFYKTNSVKVFDKAGKIVFAQSGYLNTWDGSYNGTPLTQGTYQYVVDLGNGTKYTGYISIVRD